MTGRLLQPLATPADETVLDLLGPLRQALNGSGPALLPFAAELAPAAALRPGQPLDPDEDDPHDPTVAVLATSGSTGAAKGVLLPASALIASVSASHDRLGGPGRWLLALRAHHVAGLQVLVRCLVSGTVPATLDLSDGFHPDAFAEAAARVRAPRRYTALVPTQLVRLLEAGGGPLEALAGFDAVLIGGAATPGGLLDRARAAGVRVVTTYGMSETCGGCVYDGRPLDAVQVDVDPTGRISLGGPTVARGYRRAEGPAPEQPSAEQPFAVDASGTRWFRTDDAGELAADGRLAVLGRLDDAVTTGGLTFAAAAVEEALLDLPGVAEAVAVGAADPTWGQRMVAVLVLRSGAPSPTLAQARAVVGARIEPAAAPQQLLVLDRLPLRGPGKPDRAALTRLAERSERV